MFASRPSQRRRSLALLESSNEIYAFVEPISVCDVARQEKWLMVKARVKVLLSLNECTRGAQKVARRKALSKRALMDFAFDWSLTVRKVRLQPTDPEPNRC